MKQNYFSRMPFLPLNQQRQSTEGKQTNGSKDRTDANLRQG